MASISSSASSVDAADTGHSAERKEKSKRPQLSCQSCRARKVKCDRVQPCTACSLHQIAHECTYDLTEAERKPILQAEALRLADKKIASLENELSSLRNGGHAGMSGAKHRHLPQGMNSLPAHMQPGFDGHYEDQEMMMARSMSVTQELADMTLRPKNVHGRFENFAGYRLQVPTAYPFPTLWSANEGISALYPMLPPKEEMFTYLASFERRAVGIAFPYSPKYCSRGSVEKFLSNLDQHAEQRPDVLALLFAAIAQGAFYGAVDRHNGHPSAPAMAQEIEKSNVFMATAFQALRVSAFLSRPSLCTIEALSMLAQYLCDSGKFVDAWVLIGTTVRLAVLAKFHRNPIAADLEGIQEEQTHKAALWWWLLSLDATSSMICGRPLGASTAGDCPPADFTSEHSPANSLTSIRNEVTILCRRVLDQRRFTANTIQSFTEQLRGVWQGSMNGLLGFSWSNPQAPLPLWPLDAQLALIHVLIHTLIILVNQQRQSPRGDISDPEISMSYNTVVNSAREILRIFKFVGQRLPPALQSWTLCQTAFNAAIILIRHVAQSTMPPQSDTQLVHETHGSFLALHREGIHALAGTAAVRLYDLYQDVQNQRCMPGDVLSKDGMALIEGNDLQDTMLTGYDFASGDSDMSSPHEERASPGATFSTSDAAQAAKASKKSRPGQIAPVVSNTRSGPKRTPGKPEKSTKGRSSHGWTPSESHVMSQGGRQWSVSKKQQTSSRVGSTQQKPRSRGAGVAASQYMSSQASQYLPNEVLNAFPNPPSGQMNTDNNSGWEELIAAQIQAGQVQLHGNMPVTIPAQGDISNAATSQPQAQQAATIAANQHMFTSNGQAYSQPQSPSLWGFQFPHVPQQGFGQVHDQANQQVLSQEQQIMFPGGMADPRFFWDENDGTAGQYLWGG